ncbi:MAG: hypothetical protein QXJ27_07500 [Thermoplasmata archaeon]
MDERIRKKLDYYGPYTSALGCFLATFLATVTLTNKCPSICDIVCFAPLLLPLIFSTCQHRKYKIFSLGGIGGTIGVLVGFLPSMLLALPFIYAQHGAAYEHYDSSELGLVAVSIFISSLTFFTFVFSWYFCRKLGKRWWNENVCQCGK